MRRIRSYIEAGFAAVVVISLLAWVIYPPSAVLDIRRVFVADGHIFLFRIPSGDYSLATWSSEIVTPSGLTCADSSGDAPSKYERLEHNQTSFPLRSTDLSCVVEGAVIRTIHVPHLWGFIPLRPIVTDGPVFVGAPPEGFK